MRGIGSCSLGSARSEPWTMAAVTGARAPASPDLPRSNLTIVHLGTENEHVSQIASHGLKQGSPQAGKAIRAIIAVLRNSPILLYR